MTRANVPQPWYWSEEWLRIMRALAWVILAAVTLNLVLTEAKRSEVPDGISVYTDVEYRRVGGRKERLDVYLPKGEAPPGGWPAILAIHGGGWHGGNKGGYGQMAARLAQHGFVVVSPDYVLSRPGAPSWPDNLEDVREAVRWIRRAKEINVNPRRIAALGASAGGHLAALLGTDQEQAPLDVSTKVDAVIDFYGPTDLKALAAARAQTVGPLRLLLGGLAAEFPDRYDAASPIRHVSRDDPPMLIVHGAKDALVPVEQSKALADALTAAGVSNRLIVIDHARHGFEFRIDAERDLVPDIIAFLNVAWTRRDRKQWASLSGVR
jgi:acetyl esterase/lipase